MRKAAATFLVIGLVAGLALVLAVGAIAEPSDACGSADPVAVSQGTNSATVCVKTGAVNGSITASGDPAVPNGYVVADGDSTNPDPLDGYLGVEGDSTGIRLVGCASGDYEPGGDNNVILDPNNPTPPDPADPCAPQPPA